MNSEQRKALQTHMDELIGYSLEKNGAASTIREVRPDALHTWLLLEMVELLDSIDSRLISLETAIENRR